MVSPWLHLLAVLTAKIDRRTMLLVVFGTILVSRGVAFKARDIVVWLIGRRSEDHSLDSSPVCITHGGVETSTG